MTEHPNGAAARAQAADKYDDMLRLADLFDDAGERMRAWSQLGRDILADPDVTDSAALSPTTWATAEEEVRAATTGKGGLLNRSLELDADALVLRATVMTYRWIDELQAAAYQTLGTIAGRAIGYLAPEVNLGGAIVAAGLIETDALDRDGVAAYLGELAKAHPELMEHVTTGGGLLDSLQMRGLLTAGVLSGEASRSARAGGLRATGIAPLTPGWSSALRDVAAGLTEPAPATRTADAALDDAADGAADGAADAPRGLADLMTRLAHCADSGLQVLRVAPGRLIAFVPDIPAPSPAPGRLRLVSGDSSAAATEVVRALAGAVDTGDDGPVRVLLVGHGSGGAAALEVATRTDLPGFVVDQVVTADAPATQLAVLPPHVQVLSLEDRDNPVALLGSLINAGAANRLTVVYDASAAPDVPPPVAGGRAADRSEHPELVAALTRWRELGYLRPGA